VSVILVALYGSHVLQNAKAVRLNSFAQSRNACKFVVE
jgi:hypothetical protein